MFGDVLSFVSKARIVHAAPNYAVINKPAGVPVVPTVDNIIECCLSCAAQVRDVHCNSMLTCKLADQGTAHRSSQCMSCCIFLCSAFLLSSMALSIVCLSFSYACMPLYILV